MTLNPDCVRDVLLAIEKQSYGSRLTLKDLCDTIPKYQIEDVAYTCLKLKEGNLLDISTSRYIGQTREVITAIRDITYGGHEFLENIRDNKNWLKIKKAATTVGSCSIKVLSQIAQTLIADLIKSTLLGG